MDHGGRCLGKVRGTEALPEPSPVLTSEVMQFYALAIKINCLLPQRRRVTLGADAALRRNLNLLLHFNFS